jgi:hypothetical protein
MLIPHYSHPTTPDGPGYDITLPGTVPIALYSGDTAQPSDALTGMTIAAAVGDVATSSLVFDDPTGTLGYNGDGLVGLHRMYLVEDQCSNPNDNVVFNGYVGIREYRRGTRQGVSPLGAGRRVTCDLQDDNAILSFRKIRTSDGNRPAETADARLLWLLGGVLNTVHDTGFIDHTALSHLKMDAADYRGQYARDVLNDIALQSQFNYFAQYNLSGTNSGQVELAFFNDRTSTLLTSTLQISNDPADAASFYNPLTNPSGLTFPPDDEQSYLRMDPSKTYSGVDVTYAGTGGTTGASAAGNSVYVWNSVTAFRYGARDGTAPNANIKSAAAALAEANALLRAASTESPMAYVHITVPASRVNLVKAGQRIYVKMTHWPAPYNGWFWWRVTRKTFAWALPTDALYELQLEIVPQVIPSGVHQVVLTSAACYGALSGPGGDTLLVNGVATPMVFIGADGSCVAVTLPTPTIAQDTDGYAQRINAPGLATDASDPSGPCKVTTLQIPSGLGGTYRIVWEQAVVAWIAGAYWGAWTNPTTGLPQVYSPSGVPTPLGACLMTNGSVAVSLLVNGVVVHTETRTWSGTNTYSDGSTNANFTIALHDFDVVTMSVTATGQVYNQLGNGIGANGPATQQGCLVLTWMSP